MKIIVSGLVNIETNIKIKQFPIEYYPIDYDFFGIESSVGGVGLNVSKALTTLGDSVEFLSLTGEDEEAGRIYRELESCNISTAGIKKSLKATPVSAVIYDENGKRQIYCDLKDIQEQSYELDENQKLDGDILVMCNINFNRKLLKKAEESDGLVAIDVHVLSDIEDEYNKDFCECADILFLSDEQISGTPEEFITKLKNRYKARVIVMGRGNKGVTWYDREKDSISSMPACNLGDIVNTIGAGDALFSSFIHYYGHGDTIEESLKKAQIFAALKIQKNGAANGFVTETEVNAALEKYSEL